MKTKTVFRKQQMIIEYKYQKVIDLCGNFTIFTYTNGRWQKKYTEYYIITEIQWNIKIEI